MKDYFGKVKVAIDAKYIDPTYMIRARACNSSDHIFCSILGQNAVQFITISTNILVQIFHQDIHMVLVF